MFKRIELHGRKFVLAYICSAASQVTQSILDVEEEDDRGEYNEEIIAHCSDHMPSPYFETNDFLEAFENQCNQVSRCSSFLPIRRTHLFFRTSTS